MASIVHCTNKKTGTVYVYTSESHWIPGVGCRNKRKCIGKLDPVSGKIVPTGRRGPEGTSEQIQSELLNHEAMASSASLADKQALIDATLRIQDLEHALAAKTREFEQYKRAVEEASSGIHSALAQLQGQAAKLPD